MAQRTPVPTADQLTAKHLVGVSEYPLVMEQIPAFFIEEVEAAHFVR